MSKYNYIVALLANLDLKSVKATCKNNCLEVYDPTPFLLYS